jgi:hypothetical protein
MTPLAALLLLAFLWLVVFTLLLWGLLRPRHRDRRAARAERGDAPKRRSRSRVATRAERVRRREAPPKVTPIVRTVRVTEPLVERATKGPRGASVHRAPPLEPPPPTPSYGAETDEAAERTRSRDDEAFERFWRPRDDLEF